MLCVSRGYRSTLAGCLGWLVDRATVCKELFTSHTPAQPTEVIQQARLCRRPRTSALM